jgi:AraC-like DNA-binding protein
MRTMQDIRDLIIEGHPYEKIMQQLQIPRRTFYRYLNAVFEDDRRLLAENIDDTEFMNQMAICKDRLLEHRRNLLEMAHDSSIDPSDRISAHHLIAEIAAAVLRLYEGGPAILSQRHAFPKTALTAPESTGLRLVLNNANDNPTAMKEASRLQYEEAMKRVDEEEEVRGDEGEK